MAGAITQFQQSFDRQDEATKRKLAGEFLSGYLNTKINPSDIELPPDGDKRKADFIYKGELFQIVVPNQAVSEEDVPPDSPIRPLEKQRGDVSQILRGKAKQASVVGGDPLEDIVHTIQEKFDKYGEEISKTLILIIEFVDIYEEIFSPTLAAYPPEVRKRVDAAGITFKEIWLVRRQIVKDEPTYTDRIKI